MGGAHFLGKTMVGKKFLGVVGKKAPARLRLPGFGGVFEGHPSTNVAIVIGARDTSLQFPPANIAGVVKRLTADSGARD